MNLYDILHIILAKAIARNAKKTRLFSFSADTDSSDTPSFRATVTHEGNVIWVIPMITKSSCQINVKNFPLDEQVNKLMLLIID